MQHYSDRFKDAPWYKSLEANPPYIHVIGVGGIGSNFLYNAVKSIPAHYFIQDTDVVNEYNINTQFFFPEDIGRAKLLSLKNKLNYSTSIIPITAKFAEFSSCKPIVISAVDNMETRKNIFDSWKIMHNRQLLIDGRLRANLYEIYVVRPGQEDRYAETLFEDKAVDDGPCTFKQTAYFGMLIGARITQVLANYFSNKAVGEELYTVPFKINEYGDLFLFETEL